MSSSRREQFHTGAQRGAVLSADDVYGDEEEFESSEEDFVETPADVEVSFKPTEGQSTSVATSPVMNYVTSSVKKAYNAVAGAIFAKSPEPSPVPADKTTKKRLKGHRPKSPINGHQTVPTEEQLKENEIASKAENMFKTSSREERLIRSPKPEVSPAMVNATTRHRITTAAEVHREQTPPVKSLGGNSHTHRRLSKLKTHTTEVSDDCSLSEEAEGYTSEDTSKRRPPSVYYDRKHKDRNTEHLPTSPDRYRRTNTKPHGLLSSVHHAVQQSAYAAKDDASRNRRRDREHHHVRHDVGSDSSDSSTRHRLHDAQELRSRRGSETHGRRHRGSSRRRSTSGSAERRSCSNHSRPKSSIMKPGKYDGTKSLDTFLVQFETCARYNRWSNRDKCAFLKCSLTDGPAQLLWDTGDPNLMDYDQLLERLRARYGSTGQAEKFRAELRNRRRRRGESLAELHGDIRKLMALAYPGINQSEICEVVARDHFIDALNDRDFELKVREREPPDLESALRLAVRLEAYANARNDQTDVAYSNRRNVDRGDERLAKRVAQVENNLRQLSSEVRPADHSDSADSWRRKYDQLSKDYERLKFLEEQRTFKQQVAERAEPKVSLQPAHTTTKPREPPKCYGCGKTGHFRRSCPDNQPEKASVGQSNAVQSTIADNNVSNRDCEAYLRIRINGEPNDCLLDTGSEVTLFPYRLICGATIVPVDQNLRAANGTNIPVLGRVTLNGAIGRRMITIDGLATKHVNNVILGLGWLRQHEAVWDFKTGRIKLDAQSYKLQSRRSSGLCCRVVVEETCAIPSMSEYELSTTVVFDKPSPSQDVRSHTWMTEARELTDGLLVSRTVIPPRLDNVPVRVMNVTRVPIELQPGMTVTTLQQVEPLVTSDANSSNITVEQNSVLHALVDSVDPEVPAKVREQLLDTLKEYHDTFSYHENDLGRTNIIRHSIDTGDVRPVRQQLRRQPPAHQAAIKEHVSTMLAQGIIEPAQSPWASNIVIVQKKDGTTRCCVDYRQLNNLSRKDAYPLPRTDDCLEALAGARWFTTLDLRSSYHQIEMEPADADKTTFICREGSFRYRTMPFGLCNAGATFQRLMDTLMCNLKYETCIVYLDDIIIFSRDLEQHIERLQQVLQRLKSAGLKLKPNKCQMLRQTVEFLGHIVSAKGTGVDPKKISAVADWPIPTNITELRAYLGLCGYYRKFVQGFSEIASPLYSLTSKRSQFIFTDKCVEAFETLKMKLTSAPILRMPSCEGRFILDTDASNFAIGAVLSQEIDGVEFVVAYASKRLSRSEMNYCVTRRELLAVVYFTKYFRNYLLGRRFCIRTDHAALQWLRRMPDPCGQQARWIGALEQYDYEILHRPGSRHGNADALSRRPCDKKRCCTNQDTDIELRSTKQCAAITRRAAEQAPEETESGQAKLQNTTSDDFIRQLQVKDTDIKPIYNLLMTNTPQPNWDDVANMSGPSKTMWRQWQQLKIVNGLLCRRFETADGLSSHWQMVLPSEMRQDFIKAAHEGVNGGHLGRKRTEACVALRAYWPGWREDIRTFLQQCVPCARYHRGATPRRTELKPFYAGEPWETLSLDITGPHPRSRNGHVFILTAMDHFTKWAEAFPIRNHTAPTVARVLFNNIIVRFGTPQRILTDQGAEFESSLFKELCQLLNINKIRTSAYRPSTNGMLERFHRTLNSMLAKVIDGNQRNWCEMLPGVMAAYRATVHDTTGYSPNRLLFGRENRMPIDIAYGAPPSDPIGYTVDDYIENLNRNLRGAYEIVRQNIGKAAERRKDRYDVGVKKSEITEGSWVWYFCPRKKIGLSPKWQNWYSGPYQVMRCIDSHCIVIQRSAKAKPMTVHRDKLKPFHGEIPSDWTTIRKPAQDEASNRLQQDDQLISKTDRPHRNIVRPRRFED